MISGAAVDHFTVGQLFEHLGVSLSLSGPVLHVVFANGETERWIPAPDGYPLDGSRDLIECQGRYFVPAVTL